MTIPIERVQTGIRIEKRLLEGMALHCFDGKQPFSQQTLLKIEQLKAVYDLDPTASDSHILQETNLPQSS